MSSPQHGSRPALLDALIPRFLWRAESRSSRYRVLESSEWDSQHVSYNHAELGAYISAHMKSRDPGYDAPFVITSLTGSLLWALNYAHFLLSRGEQEIRIVLVDAWSARTDHIYPARYVTACLEIPPLGVRWHDDPYHEYFVFGDFPSDAILGSFELDSAADEDLNILVPGFNIVDRYEGLLDSLSRFQREWKNSGAIFDTLADPVGITDDDLWAARAVASRFTDPDDPDIQFQLTMMFLALRNRDWKRPDVWSAVRDMFQGVRIPPLYLYRLWAVPIDLQMPDVVRWVRGMERIRLDCMLDSHTPGSGIRVIP